MSIPKHNKQNIKINLSDMIISTSKNYDFCSLSKASNFEFFSENIFRTMSYGLNFIHKSHKKNTFSFNRNMPIFQTTFLIFVFVKTLLVLIQTFLKKELAKSVPPFSSVAHTNAQCFIFIYIDRLLRK